MRNIKSTLRFARNSALLFVAASGMAYLSSCSETDINPDNGGNNGDDNVLVEMLKVTSGTNPALAKTYRNSHQIGTRAAFDVPEHPGMPATPSSYDIILTKEWDCNSLYITLPASTDSIDMPTSVGNKIYVPTGYAKSLPDKFTVTYQIPHYDNNPGWVHYSSVVTVENPKYYIDGAVNISGFGGDEYAERELHILKDGKFSCSTNIPYKTTVYLYGGGDILKASDRGDKIIYHKGTLIAEEAIDHADTDITIEGDVFTYGKIHGKNVKLIGGNIFAGCAVMAETELSLTGTNSLISAGYVSAPDVTLAGSASSLKILLRNGGYLNATNELHVANVGNVYVEAEEGDYAMIETKNLKVNNEDLVDTFRNLGIYFKTTAEGTNLAGSEGEGLKFDEASVKANIKGAYELVDGDANSCAPKLVMKPGGDDDNKGDDNTGDDDDNTGGGDDNNGDDPDPTPVLENIGSIAPTGDHTHPISATCIFTNGKDAYLSWHTQGPNFHGCIEYLTVDNGNVSLNAFLETAPSNDEYGAIDFNHVIFDNGKIFVAGDHPKKGGILGWIHCNNGAFVTGQADLNIKELYNGEGGSGNCIIRNGNYYQVASVKGFETYNVNDFNIGATSNRAVARLAAYDFDPAGENAQLRQSGKHIAIDKAESKVAMLTLINRDNSANTANASIKVFDASDVTFGNEIASYVINDPLLTPVDGKDVIAIEGNDIWVCLGNGGVMHLELNGTSISEVSRFSIKGLGEDEMKSYKLTAKEAASSCANGLAVDEKYVYVAHGGAGLVVLKKDDLSFVTRSRYNGGNSANYVALHEDGYIYVAYGKSNVQVFGWRLNQN